MTSKICLKNPKSFSQIFCLLIYWYVLLKILIVIAHLNGYHKIFKKVRKTFIFILVMDCDLMDCDLTMTSVSKVGKNMLLYLLLTNTRFDVDEQNLIRMLIGPRRKFKLKTFVSLRKNVLSKWDLEE